MSTDDKRCELTDLVTWMCAHCLGHVEDMSSKGEASASPVGHETEWVDQFLKDESAD